jgi:hypothetical protein
VNFVVFVPDQLRADCVGAFDNRHVRTPNIDAIANAGIGRETNALDFKALKRTPGALRQKARNLGISIGHRQRPKKRTRRG